MSMPYSLYDCPPPRQFHAQRAHGNRLSRPLPRRLGVQFTTLRSVRIFTLFYLTFLVTSHCIHLYLYLQLIFVHILWTSCQTSVKESWLREKKKGGGGGGFLSVTSPNLKKRVLLSTWNSISSFVPFHIPFYFPISNNSSRQRCEKNLVCLHQSRVTYPMPY